MSKMSGGKWSKPYLRKVLEQEVNADSAGYERMSPEELDRGAALISQHLSLEPKKTHSI